MEEGALATQTTTDKPQERGADIAGGDRPGKGFGGRGGARGVRGGAIGGSS
jgi:hypothetical protein